MTSRKTVMDIISNERDWQISTLSKLGNSDTTFPLFDWLNFIDAHLLQARRAETIAESTAEIRNLAACAVAALEQYGAADRDREGRDRAGALLDDDRNERIDLATLDELLTKQRWTAADKAAAAAAAAANDDTKVGKAFYDDTNKNHKKYPADRRAEKKRRKDDDDDLYGIGSLNLNDDDDDDDDDED